MGNKKNKNTLSFSYGGYDVGIVTIRYSPREYSVRVYSHGCLIYLGNNSYESKAKAIIVAQLCIDHKYWNRRDG